MSDRDAFMRASDSSICTLAKQIGEEIAASRGRIRAHPNEVKIIDRYLRVAVRETYDALQQEGQQ